MSADVVPPSHRGTRAARAITVGVLLVALEFAGLNLPLVLLAVGSRITGGGSRGLLLLHGSAWIVVFLLVLIEWIGARANAVAVSDGSDLPFDLLVILSMLGSLWLALDAALVAFQLAVPRATEAVRLFTTDPVTGWLFGGS